MAIIEVNAVGDACPIPVVKATKALSAMTEPGTLIVSVDNETAVQNLTRLGESKGLAVIESKGKDFDTDFHEAVTQFPAPSPELKGKVIDVVQTGYTLNGKVLRYAKVVVGA